MKRPTFTFLKAASGLLTMAPRIEKATSTIDNNCFHVSNTSYKYARVGNAPIRVGNARWKRNRLKPGATPQVHNHQAIVALQAQQ